MVEAFAEQAKNHGTRRIDGLLGFSHTRLNRVARLVLFEQPGADFLHLPLQFPNALSQPRPLSAVLLQAAFQIRCFLVGACHALFDTRSFANLRFQAALGALGFEVHFRQLFARARELGLQCIKHFLRLLPFGIVIGGLQRPDLSVRRRLRRCG